MAGKQAASFSVWMARGIWRFAPPNGLARRCLAGTVSRLGEPVHANEG